MVFEHTFRERGMWRGWLRNGQSVELSRGRSGWEFGAGVLIHSNDSDDGDRLICLKFWRFSAFIPIGIVPGPFVVGDEPQWSAFAHSDIGLVLHWRLRRKSFDWPWSWHTLAYEEQMTDGSWRDVLSLFREPKPEGDPYTEVHPYTYTLRSGEVQHRTATISKRRHVLCRRAFKAIGWPRTIRESIDIRFNDEVGERTGSWKGGAVGCGYSLLPGESMEMALRRMERERTF